MDTKEKIEKEIDKAMKSIEEIQRLVKELPEEEDNDCFMSNLIDMNGKLKYFCRKSFDELARKRTEVVNE